MNIVSIITPFFKGNSFLPSLTKNIQEVAKSTPEAFVEWIVVNDSPNIEIDLKSNKKNNLSIKVFENKKNEGIQKTRINGLKKSTGKYVIFLDQDDKLFPNAVKVHLANIKENNASITNGYNEVLNGKKYTPMFKNKHQMLLLNDIDYYFYIGNLIGSPGMVMLKKKAISRVWLDNILSINGADDWLLWVEYLNEGHKFSICDSFTYIHNKTAFNTSDNTEKMLQSSKEALNLANSIDEKLKKVYARRLLMRKNIEIKDKNKYIQYILNPDITLKMFLYKL